MMERIRSALPAMIVAVVLVVLLAGGAVAAVSIPDRSVGCSKLIPKIQKRVGCRPGSEGPRRPALLIPATVGPQGKQGEQGTVGPEGPSGAIEPRCELVEGECLIYSEEFWQLQAALEPFETGTGAYPEPPFCMKAVADGEPLACAQVTSYLYPDGTLGDAPWAVDPNDPKGWRFF